MLHLSFCLALCEPGRTVRQQQDSGHTQSFSTGAERDSKASLTQTDRGMWRFPFSLPRPSLARPVHLPPPACTPMTINNSSSQGHGHTLYRFFPHQRHVGGRITTQRSSKRSDKCVFVEQLHPSSPSGLLSAIALNWQFDLD